MSGNTARRQTYSTPMAAPTKDMRCQTCGSTSHWTYDHKSTNQMMTSSTGGITKNPLVSSSTPSGAKLSRTQMLRLGITKPLQAIAPPKTEKEQFDEQIAEASKMLDDEAKVARREQQATRKRAREEQEEKGASEQSRDSNEKQLQEHSSTSGVHPLDLL